MDNFSKEDYVQWMCERIVNTLLYSRRKHGENCGVLQAKLTAFLLPMLQSVYAEGQRRIAK